MKKASLTETKNNLSALVDQVRRGETVLILDRGRPVARLESVLEGEVEPTGRVARLERQGVLRRPLRRRSLKWRKTLPPQASAHESVLAALLDERRSGR
jgi:prevent-host-death family protein